MGVRAIAILGLGLALLAGAACSDSAAGPAADDAGAPPSTTSDGDAGVADGATPADASSDSADGDAGTGWPSQATTGPRTPTTSTQGDVTFSNAGTQASPIIHEKIHFDGVVTLTSSAAWHVFRDCEVTNTSYWGFRVEGASHVVIEHCDVSGAQTAVSIAGDDITVRANDLHDVENGVTTYGTHVEIADNWIHNDGVGKSWGGSPHWDAIEIYGGSHVNIVHNELSLDGHDDTSLVNVAPWGNGDSVSNVTVTGNRMGGGGYHVTLDNAQANGPHAVTAIVLSGNRHRAIGGYGLANIRDGVDYTWSDLWDCNGAAAPLGVWPPPCK